MASGQGRGSGAAMADPLAVLAAAPPQVDAAQAVAIALEYFGLRAQARELVSERDRNFRLRCDDGRQYVLKIANAAEDPQVSDFQIQALQHIASRNAPIAVPRVVPALDGRLSIEVATPEGPRVTRLVTWLDGVLLRSQRTSVALAADFGRYASQLGAALEGFEHPAAGHSLLWDMRRAGRVRELVDCIAEPPLRQRVTDCLDGFLQTVLPEFPSLRSQVIHNDLNPDNVLVDAGDATRVVGVIDFGDMLRAPLVVDVAVAASYMRATGSDPLELIAPFVAAYQSVRPLAEQETALVFDLVRARLAMTTAILHWRLAARGADDPYLHNSSSTESNAATFLERLDAIPRERAKRQLAQA